MSQSITLRLLGALALTVSLAACVSQSVKSTSVPSVNGASSEVAEDAAAGCGHRRF